MGLIATLSLGQSSGAVRGLVIPVATLVVGYIAIAKIITQAGYSAKWILVPLAPVCLWIGTFVLLVVDVRSSVIGGFTVSQPVSLGNFEALAILDGLSVIVAGIFFFVFAFSTWPATAQRGGSKQFDPNRLKPYTPLGDSSPPVQPVTAKGPALAKVDPLPPNDDPLSQPATQDVPDSLNTNTSRKGNDIFCSWCGSERTLNAAAIHYCGSMDRPAAFCMDCGAPLEDEASNCAACGLSAATMSRR